MSNKELQTNATTEDADAFFKIMQDLVKKYKEKITEFLKYSDSIDSTRFNDQEIDVDRSFIYDMAQLNDELAFIEDELFNLFNKFTNKDVDFVRNGRKVQPSGTEYVSKLVSYMEEKRKTRYWNCVTLSNYLYKKNKDLYEEFQVYIQSLSIPYNGETKRTDEIFDSLPINEKPTLPLDYWIEFE